MAVPLAEAKDPTTDQQQQVALVGVGAIVAATGLGWLFGGRAVRPLVELTQRVGRRDRDLATAASGVREADELAAAAGAMLQDVSDAQETHRGRARHRPRLRGRVRARTTDPAHRHAHRPRGTPPSTCPTNSAPRSSPTSRGQRAGSRPRSPRWNGSRRASCPARRTTSTST
ncbi:hypothetical protein GS436_09030 [Rhodococcus hoagii]|nr:hypothetical protein [Prescottella equi]